MQTHTYSWEVKTHQLPSSEEGQGENCYTKHAAGWLQFHRRGHYNSIMVDCTRTEEHICNRCLHENRFGETWACGAQSSKWKGTVKSWCICTVHGMQAENNLHDFLGKGMRVRGATEGGTFCSGNTELLHTLWSRLESTTHTFPSYLSQKYQNKIILLELISVCDMECLQSTTERLRLFSGLRIKDVKPCTMHGWGSALLHSDRTEPSLTPPVKVWCVGLSNCHQQSHRII